MSRIKFIHYLADSELVRIMVVIIRKNEYMKNEVLRILYAISKDIIVGISQIVPCFALCYLFNLMEKYKEAEWPFFENILTVMNRWDKDFQLFLQIEGVLLLYIGIAFLLPLIYNLIRKKFRFVLAQFLLMTVGFIQFGISF